MIENIIPNTFRRIDSSSYLLFIKIIEKYFARMTKGCLVIKDPKRDVYLSFGKEEDFQATIIVNQVDFYRRLVLGGDIGLAETYMEGMWDTPCIDDVVKWFIINLKNSPAMSGSEASTSPLVNAKELGNRIGHFIRSNTKTGSRKNIENHYDLGNDFFNLFLDQTMTYSSGVYCGDHTLEAAQAEKFSRLAESGRMADGLEVLEVGTGWGEFSCYLATNFNCKITTTTISKEQYDYAKAKVRERNLEDKITVLYRDYRDLTGKYDRIFTVEMLEAVGDRFINVFFEKANSLLKSNGVMAHQVILCADNRYEQLKNGVDFIQKHIFPGSLLPSVSKLLMAANAADDYMLLDYNDYGKDYYKTLKAWQKNFNDKKAEVKTLGFDDYFIRKWNYYFSYCASAFVMKNITVGHIALTRMNNFELDGLE